MYETNSLSKFLSPLISFICGKDAISVPGIVCGTFWGSFAVQFGDHLRYWDHLRARIICGPVQLFTSLRKTDQIFLSSPAGYIPSFLGANIKIVDWLPQNDLLAHKDIKAFVSHVGHNSLYESAYHGVPVVAFPLYADQHSNAKKAQHFGIGLAVDSKTSNAQQLFETIERVITEPR